MAAILRQNAHHTPAYWWRGDDEANQCMGMTVMMVRSQWGSLARMPGLNPYSFLKDILGFLMTRESQDLLQYSVPITILGVRAHTEWASPAGLTYTSSSSILVFPGGLPSRYWPGSALLSFGGQPVLGSRVMWLLATTRHAFTSVLTHSGRVTLTGHCTYSQSQKYIICVL